MIDHLSYSQIQEYLICQQSYKHKYIDKVEVVSNEALEFGGAWHKMITQSLVGGDAVEAWNEETKGRYDFNYQGLQMLQSESVASTLQGLKPYPEMIDHYTEFTIPPSPRPRHWLH